MPEVARIVKLYIVSGFRFGIQLYPSVVFATVQVRLSPLYYVVNLFYNGLHILELGRFLTFRLFSANFYVKSHVSAPKR